MDSPTSHLETTRKDADGSYYLTVPQRGFKRLDLGRFSTDEPKPGFDVTYKPAVEDDMARSETQHLLDDTHYRLVMHFENYGSKPVLVTVKPVSS